MATCQSTILKSMEIASKELAEKLKGESAVAIQFPKNTHVTRLSL